MARAWMVIDATEPAELAIAASNGATHGLVQVYWDQVQSSAGGAVTATGVLGQIADVRAAGLKVCLRVSPQYIPSFVDSAGVKFKRNGGAEHNPGNPSGNNARDWIWSASTRALVDDFLTKLFNQLTWSHIDRVQLGGVVAGELSYPDSDGTVWWGYSAPAQTGTGIASGQVVCPVPGHVPSTGTTWTSNDIAFVEWYLNGLTNWMLWLIAKHRVYYSGPIWVMHPGAGLREISQTPTSPDQALNYRVNVAKGVDWGRQISAYPDADVHPYSTWVDAEHFWPPDPFNATADGNAAPWFHLRRVAAARGRASRIWGENTGNNSNTDMERFFTVGALSYGYEGLVWLSHDSLMTSESDTYASWKFWITSLGEGTPPGTLLPYSRGVNMAGGEFAASSSTLPGVYGTDYAYDTADALATIAGRGHKLIRLPFRWERIQPTRGAALDTVELARLQQVITNAYAVGMRTVLDVHNYARFIQSTADGGAELVLGSPGLPVGDLVDLWTRLSAAFRNNRAIYAYGLMNEPHDLAAAPGEFTGTVRYDWASGVQGWTGDSATASNVSGKLRLSATVGSGSVNFRKDDAGTVSGGSTPTGSAIRFEATLVADPGGSWSAKAQWQNASYAYQNPTSVTYQRIDNGVAVAGLILGVAVRVTCVFSSIASPPQAFALQIDGSGATAGAATVDIDNFAQGTVAAGLTGAEVLESACQTVTNAIRAAGDNTLLLIPGYGYSGAQNWRTHHPDPYVIDPAGNIAYEAHYYFDVDNSGDYPDSYATENSAAISAGYASLTARATTELGRWVSWLQTFGVRGFLGEIGWPGVGGDTASWNAVGEALYDLCDTASIDVTYWSAGERWGTGYNLSAYTGATQATARPPALIIEAHPTTAVITPPPPPEPETPAVVVGNRNAPLYPSPTAFPGLATFPGGPPLGSPFLSETLSPYARLAIEAAFGANPGGDPDDWFWTDITGDVRQDQGVKLKHGRGDQAAKPQPASMACVLDNRAGRYSQAPGTLNYPYVRRGVPIRVSVNLGENLDNAALPGRPPGLRQFPSRPLAPPQQTYRVLWQGFADGWSPEWDTTGRDATVTLAASGTLRRLQQGSAPAPSVMRRYIPRGARRLIGYWPMEDGEAATTIAPGISGLQPMSIIGAPNLAKADRVRFSDPVLQIHGSTMSGALQPYAVTSAPAVIANVVIDMSDDGSYTGNDAEILRIWLTGGTLAYVGLKVRYNSNPVGIPSIFARAVGASSDISGLDNVTYRTLIDYPTVARLRIQQVGADVQVRLSLRLPGELSAGGFTYTLAGQTFSRATRVVVGARGDLNLVGVGHLAVAEVDSTLNAISVVTLSGYSEFAGELAHTRIARICAEEAIRLDLRGVSTSRCGEQGATPVLDVITEAAEVDQGTLLDGLGPGLTYVCRSVRESKTAALTLDVAAGQLAKELGVADDDEGTRNSWEIERKGGQKATVIDADGPMGVDTVGLYDSSKKINMLSDTDAEDYASWLVRLGTVVGYRFPRVNLDLARDPGRAAAWVLVRPSDRIDLVNMRTVRTQLPADSTSLLVEGYSQTISRYRWDVQINCSPAEPWRVGVYAASEGDRGELLQRLASDGTRTTTGVVPGATSLQVVTPTGPLWTTATDDYPLSLDVGGFEVVATACSAGVDGVQTFTIAPAVGTLLPGVPVDLYRQPAPGL